MRQTETEPWTLCYKVLKVAEVNNFVYCSTNTSARYVTVSMNAAEYVSLYLAEVEIYNGKANSKKR